MKKAQRLEAALERELAALWRKGTFKKLERLLLAPVLRRNLFPSYKLCFDLVVQQKFAKIVRRTSVTCLSTARELNRIHSAKLTQARNDLAAGKLTEVQFQRLFSNLDRRFGRSAIVLVPRFHLATVVCKTCRGAGTVLRK